VDTYPARVRLPDEPLMLVDRILSVDGQKGSLGPGRVVTEHDVVPGAWYLDGGHAPVCISVEAGQADLFLCAYLGIDLQVKGLRTYRLLDASVQFHRRLPLPEMSFAMRSKSSASSVRRKPGSSFFISRVFIGNNLLITMEMDAPVFLPKWRSKTQAVLFSQSRSFSRSREKSLRTGNIWYPDRWKPSRTARLRP